MTTLLAIGLGWAVGWSAGWLTSWWIHRHARRIRRAQVDAIREAERIVGAAGPILQREIERIQDEIAREKHLH